VDLAGIEHPVELALEELARLAVQHREHLAPHRVLAPHALRTGLPLAVPGADVVRAIDDVEPDGERVDNARREVALRLDLARAQRHLRGQVLRQFRARDHGSEDVRRDDDDVARHVLGAPLREDHLKRAERFVLIAERQIENRAARRGLVVRAAVQPRGRGWDRPRRLHRVAGRGDRDVTRAVGAAHP
jgi:hypothetical protein